MTPGVPVTLDGLSVAAFPVNHAKAASGFVLWEDGGARNIAYTGDTGPSDAIWRYLDSLPFSLSRLITEVSFPSSMQALAEVSRHLTPRMLHTELDKLAARPEILIYHMKAPFAAQIQQELEIELAGRAYRLLRENDVITI
jgi:ribonuclease BN (tRNA processing enzyme)